MRYYLDTEFMEDGRTIELLSLALVAQDGREFYAVNVSANRGKANPWVQENVIPHLYDEVGYTTKWPWGAAMILGELRDGVLEFIGATEGKPEFWGYYADYDWVAFCQLFGPMVALPKGWPMYCRDIKQLCDEVGNPELPQQGKGEHHALQDARWNKQAHEFLMAREARLDRIITAGARG